MTYGWRVALIGFVFAVLVLGANTWLIAAAREWASDDLHAGHGSSSFPPQGARR